MVSFTNEIIDRIKYLLLIMPFLKPERLAFWIAGMLVLGRKIAHVLLTLASRLKSFVKKLFLLFGLWAIYSDIAGVGVDDDIIGVRDRFWLGLSILS